MKHPGVDVAGPERRRPRRPVRTARTARTRIVAAATGLVAAAVLAGPPAAHADPATPAGTGAACTHEERRHSLQIEQRRVLDLIGDLRVLRDKADLDRLAAGRPGAGTAYNDLSHMYNSMRGIGFTVVNTGAAGPGKPILLFYRPDPHATDVTNPFVPNYPYTFAGWGYVAPYTPGHAPTFFSQDPGLRCLAPDDWFVHERSVHPSDTWQNIAVPPAEQYHGQAAGAEPPTAAECGCPIGMAHGRFWDVHFWLDGGRTPKVSMFNPGRPIPGFPTVPDVTFFYPEQGPEQDAE